MANLLTNATKTTLDGDNDSPAAARSELASLVDKVNSIITTFSSLGETKGLPRSVSYSTDSALAALKSALQNDYHAVVNGRFGGDSITWGMTTTGQAAIDPRTAALTDPRNNLTSPSTVNLVRDILGKTYAAGSVIAGSPGAGSYQKDIYLPLTDIGIVQKTAAGVTEAKVGGTSQYDTVGNHCDLIYNASSKKGMEFDLYGDSLTIYHSQIPDMDAYDVIVDGTPLAGGPFSTAGTTTYSVARTHTFNLGQHHIRIENAQTVNANIRLEAVKWTKKINIANDGIIGVPSDYWLPGGPLLDDSVQSSDEFIFLMIGTNDRSSTAYYPYSPSRTGANVKAIAEHLRDTHNKKVVIMCANQVTESEVAKKFTMADLARTLARYATAIDFDFINHFPVTDALIRKGISILADGLHPNDAGHAVMAANIIQAIEES